MVDIVRFNPVKFPSHYTYLSDKRLVGVATATWLRCQSQRQMLPICRHCDAIPADGGRMRQGRGSIGRISNGGGNTGPDRYVRQM